MQKRMSIMVDKDLDTEIHQLMNYSLQTEEGLTLYRLYEGISKQEWYRQVLRAGISAKRQEFERRKNELTKGANS